MSIFQAAYLAIVLQGLIFVQSYEYCKFEKKLCSSGRHIACFKEQIEPVAAYKKHYFMTNVLRDVFVYWHNYYRNEVACGRVKGSDGTLPSASRMRELVWDYELEYLAGIHAGRCKMQHDKCRNTMRFKFSGQNLEYRKTTGDPYPPLHSAQHAIFKWFEESLLTPIAIISDYEEVKDVKIGHFTVVANDRVAKVGCAMTQAESFPTESWKSTYIFVTCNYDNTNIYTMPVYKTGDAASNCDFYDVRKSSNFSCLCGKSN